MQTLHVRIGGRVQGVGYRWFVREEARRLGLSGWVTNLPSGDVEVRAGGEQRSLERLRQALQVGPAGAQVNRVEDVGGDGAGGSDGAGPMPYPFNIRR